MTANVIRFRGRNLPLDRLEIDEQDLDDLLRDLDPQTPCDPDARKATIEVLHWQRWRHGSLAAARRAARMNRFDDHQPEGAA